MKVISICTHFNLNPDFDTGSIVTVTCTIAADNFVMGVKLISENGETVDLEVDHNGVGWTFPKTVTFQQSNLNERGALAIHAEDGKPDQDHCYLAGLVVHCEASDPQSRWNDFQTSVQDWHSEDGKELCSNNGALFLNPLFAAFGFQVVLFT